MTRNDMLATLFVCVLVGFFFFRFTGCVEKYNKHTHEQRIKRIEQNIDRKGM